MSKDTSKDYIDVVEGTEVHQIDHGSFLGHPTFPNQPYPGYAVETPTCSKPSKENKGCDAWDKCTTKGAGPYAVAFINPAGNQSSCHCRQWMRALRFKPDYEVVRGEEVYEPFVQRIAVDPSDAKKGYRLRKGKMLVHRVKDPITLAQQMNPERKKKRMEQQVFDEQMGEVIPVDPVTERLSYGYRGTDDQGDQAGGEGPVGSEGNRKGRGRPKRRTEGTVGDMPGQE